MRVTVPVLHYKECNRLYEPLHGEQILETYAYVDTLTKHF